MANIIELDNHGLSLFAERVNKARKLYGQDSPYVIGVMAAFEWLSEMKESGGSELLVSLADRIDQPGSVSKPQTQSSAGKVDEESKVTVSDDALEENTWIKGAVKWFNNDKGYGFISTENKVDVFVHWRDISSWDRSLLQDDEVEFMVTRTTKGFQAINVMKAGSDDNSSSETDVEESREVQLESSETAEEEIFEESTGEENAAENEVVIDEGAFSDDDDVEPKTIRGDLS